MAAVVQNAAGFALSPLPTPSFSPLPLPALAPSVPRLQVADPFRRRACDLQRGQTRCCPRSVIRMADDEPIPEAIVEAEAKATPMRPVRQQAYVLLGAISLIAGGGLAASKQGGVAAADSLAARSIAPTHAARDHTLHEYDPCIKNVREPYAICVQCAYPRQPRDHGGSMGSGRRRMFILPVRRRAGKPDEVVRRGRGDPCMLAYIFGT